MIKYTYFVAFTAISVSGERGFGNAELMASRKITEVQTLVNSERLMESEHANFTPNTVVITNFKVIKRHINWWWSK